MDRSIAAQIKRLKAMTVPQLQQEWERLFGQPTLQRQRRALFHKLADEIQMRHFGTLPPEAQAQAVAYRERFRGGAAGAGLPGKKAAKSPRAPQARARGRRDKRLPQVGAVLYRDYRGHPLAVKVLDRGFEFEGRVYRSLSAIAREVTGTAWNGYLFFGLTKEGQR